MPSDRPLDLDSTVVSLTNSGISRFGVTTAKKLAAAVAAAAGRSKPESATVEDLLSIYPMRYEDRSNMAKIADLRDGAEVSLELWTRVSGGFQVGKRRGPHQPKLFVFEITASDPANSGKPVVIYWFISGKAAHAIVAYHRNRFSRGTKFVAYGRWEWDQRRNTFSLKLNRPDEIELLPGNHLSTAPLLDGAVNDEPSAETQEQVTDEDDISDPELSPIHVGRRVPVYRKLGPLNTKRLREIFFEVLARLPDRAISETLPPSLRQRQRLIPRAEAMRKIHFPGDEVPVEDYQESRSPAHIRLIFEEFFWASLAIALRRDKRLHEPRGAVIELTDHIKSRLSAVLPFTLTGAQIRVLEQIFNDMQSDSPMNRLLQGDVGSGKTIVAVQAMLAAMENGYQTALMAPTEILAEQHSRTVKRLLAKSPYRVELLTGSIPAARKRAIAADVTSGEIQALVGTHAIIQESTKFANLGLAVIDEQHRFGVLQRAELRERGLNPDILVMTATPIPRSLAMTIYGDLDVSVIDELPPGRTPVKTVVCGEDQRAGIYKGVEREVRRGKQVYIVYPLVEESEKMDLKDATRMFEHLRDRVFPTFTIALLHGRMKGPEKEDVMRRFAGGEIQILVSTTVIEVGVDVPNASLMIIEHAERFGLSQLHQLRGRVGRGAGQSACVLLATEKQTSVARERLGIMSETNDGFRIAEKDLEIRGPGEIMGTRQSGIPTFKLGNLVRDIRLLQAAKQEATHYLTTLRSSPETKKLLRLLKLDPRFNLSVIG
jgi:ATP-dependent DNA helicase RecG